MDFASFVSARVQAPERVEEDAAVQLSTTAAFSGRRLTLGSVPRVLVISALYAGDDPEPVERWEWEVDPERVQGQERDMSHRFGGVTLGRLRLRQSFWLAVGSTGNEPVLWEAGQPVMPVTMTVKDQFQEVREVVVVPRPKVKPGSPPGEPR